MDKTLYVVHSLMPASVLSYIKRQYQRDMAI